MSHIISAKVTKFQKPLLITVGVADEKPEGGQKAPPAEDRVKAGSHDPIFWSDFYSNSKKLLTRINISMSWNNAREKIWSENRIVWFRQS